MVQLFHCSFRTGKGLGYSAHFSGPMLVLECAVKTGKKENKVLHHLVKFEFHPQKVKISCNTIYNIASKFVLSNSIVLACFIFLLCTLMTSANKSLEKKNFHWVENVIKQLVHTSAVCSSRYEALGKFGEHSRS